MDLLLKTLSASIEQEKPVRANQIFLKTFYGKNVWRQNGESMQQYAVRRTKDFSDLTTISAETKISDDLKSMLLMTFAGLTDKEQAGILSSTANSYELSKITTALKVQYLHAENQPVNRSAFPVFGGQRDHRPMFNKHRTRQVLMSLMEDAEDPESYTTAQEGEPHSEPEDDDNACSYSDDEGLDAFIQALDMEEADEGELEVLAQVYQKRKSKGKGKGKGGGAKKPGAPNTTAVPFKATGELTFNEKAREQRKTTTAAIKQRTQCVACDQFGHWKGDSGCSKRTAQRPGAFTNRKPTPGKKAHNVFFTLCDDDQQDDPGTESSVNVVTVEERCTHKPRDQARGANGSARYITCQGCKTTLISSKTREGADLWGYLALDQVWRHSTPA
jgi:hypothetical protein